MQFDYKRHERRFAYRARRRFIGMQNETIGVAQLGFDVHAFSDNHAVPI